MHLSFQLISGAAGDGKGVWGYGQLCLQMVGALVVISAVGGMRVTSDVVPAFDRCACCPFSLRPSINGLFTDGNINLNNTQDYKSFRDSKSEILQVTVNKIEV